MHEFPDSIIIEPTNYCNLECIYCPRRFLPSNGGYMSLTLFRWLVDEIKEHRDRTVILFHRGESLLHPDIIPMLRYIRGKVGRIMLATNGMLLDDQLMQEVLDTVNFLSLSLDTEERFNNTRVGGDYARIVWNMKCFLSANQSQVETQVSMVRTDSVNDEDVRKFTSTWEGLVDRVRVYDEHSRNGKFGSVAQERNRKPCYKVRSQVAVSWDGAIRRCNHDWDGEPIGNAAAGGIGVVWRGRYYRELRSQHDTGAITDSVCKPCGSWYEKEDEAGTGVLVKKGAAQ